MNPFNELRDPLKIILAFSYFEDKENMSLTCKLFSHCHTQYISENNIKSIDDLIKLSWPSNKHQYTCDYTYYLYHTEYYDSVNKTNDLKWLYRITRGDPSSNIYGKISKIIKYVPANDSDRNYGTNKYCDCDRHHQYTYICRLCYNKVMIRRRTFCKCECTGYCNCLLTLMDKLRSEIDYDLKTPINKLQHLFMMKLIFKRLASHISYRELIERAILGDWITYSSIKPKKILHRLCRRKELLTIFRSIAYDVDKINQSSPPIST
jgi:hypothetical protein